MAQNGPIVVLSIVNLLHNVMLALLYKLKAQYV